MKKCIFALLSFFFLAPLVFAETLVEQEVSNGKVSLGIKTDQGYMDAFEAEIKVSDNVTIKNFTWDNFLSTMAVKESSISGDKKTIHFVVSAKASNILLASKTITLGVLEVTSNQDVDYSFNLSKFSFTDLEKNRKSATRLIQSEKQYHFVASKQEENEPSTPSESEPSTPGTQNPEEQPSNPSGSESESSSQNPSGSTSSSSNGSGNDVEQDNTSSTEEKPNDSEEDKQEEKPNSSDTNKEDKNDKDNNQKENNKEIAEEEKNKNQSVLLYITLGGIVLCLVILLIIFLVRKK